MSEGRLLPDRALHGGVDGDDLRASAVAGEVVSIRTARSKRATWTSPGRLSRNSPFPGVATKASNTTALRTSDSPSSRRHHCLQRAMSCRFFRLLGRNGGLGSTSAAMWTNPEGRGSANFTCGNRAPLLLDVNVFVSISDSLSSTSILR